ncbi:contact-dependent growth inhibition system immunity protein [Pantoea allii]|uniref:contact-dependent growth inhibition system immunity protein n=1 Tax=Pantoea allii TaxID=574096 RepID=UPI003977670D
MFSRLTRYFEKSNKKKYPTCRDFLVIFCGPDYDIFGESLDEIISSWLEYENAHAFSTFYNESDKLLSMPDDLLNEIMAELAEGQYSLSLAENSWRGLLMKVRRAIEKRQFDGKETSHIE